MSTSVPFKLLLVGVLWIAGVLGAVNQLSELRNFGPNPTNVRAFIYKPPNVVSRPALIVALHYCSGTAQAYFGGTQYANLADQHKNFIVIYGQTPETGGCWDVNTQATLKHDQGGDSLGIASVVRFAISNHNVDPGRVFVTGGSSGAMMTQVMAGAYPDLFKAAVSFAGVPYACFAGTGSWSVQCAHGENIKTPQQWGDLVRSGYPGYTGPRPKMQIWHGTADTTLYYNNQLEAIKQWTNVFGYSTIPIQTVNNWPYNGWKREVFGPNFEAITAQGVGHSLPSPETEVLKWFGLTGSQPTTTSTSRTTTTTAATPTGGGTQARWGQCGGIGWTGPTSCAAPYVCTYSNPYYSQCL